MTTAREGLSRARVRLAPVVGLALVWVLLWGNLWWANVLAGLLVAVVVLAAFPLPRLAIGVRPQPLGVLILTVVFLRDLVVGSLRVAALAVRPSPIGTGALVQVTLSESNDLRRTIIAEMTSLVPGTVVIDLDPLTNRMLVHVLDSDAPEDVAREVEAIHRLEQRVKRAFGGSGGPR